MFQRVGSNAVAGRGDRHERSEKSCGKLKTGRIEKRDLLFWITTWWCWWAMEEKQ